MSGTSGTSGRSGTSGTSGTSGKSGASGSSGNPLLTKSSPSWIAVSGSSYRSTLEDISNPMSLSSVKNSSVCLNVNNMKGIDLRKKVRSKKVNASECF